MDWKSSVEFFLKKRRCSLSFCQFFVDTLDLDNKNMKYKWRVVSQNLIEWNRKYMYNYESISLVSPVMWTMDITICDFSFNDDINGMKDWLYWAFLSAYINICVLNDLILKREENKKNPQKYFMVSQESIGLDVEKFITDCDKDYLFKKNYIWINKEVFLQELAQKRKSSYKKLIKLSNNISNNKKYILDRLPMYRKYKRYETLFQDMISDGIELQIAEVNPKGMDYLTDDCMWYIIRAESHVYLMCIQDYS